MFFKNKKSLDTVLGVDFSTDEIRIVELERMDDENYKILNFIIRPIPKGTINSDILNVNILGNFMRNIAIEEKLSGKKVVCSVSNSSIFQKTMVIPKDASERETESLIRNSGKTHYAANIENASFDFYELQEKRTENEKTIELKLCPIEAISSREDILNMAELTPVIIDIEDRAIENVSSALEKQYKQVTGNEISDDSMIIIDVRKGRLITRIIKNKKVQSYEESLFKLDYKDDEETVIREKLDTILDKIIFLETTADRKVNAIFLMGEYKKLIKIKRYLEDDESIYKETPIIISNPLINIKYSGVNPSEIILAAPSLVLACGLAMRDISQYE